MIPGVKLMRVEGCSMEPTLSSGDLVLVNERAYRVRPPRRGELVAARPATSGDRALVKRITGLPRERLEVAGRSWQLGENQYFLLGDQPDQSRDSRSFGPVSSRELMGPIQCRLWPRPKRVVQ